MGALKDESTIKSSDRPPSSESRPISGPSQSRLNDTDPSMPPPDPNRPVVRSRSERVLRAPEAGPDSLDAPEYVAPTPPPPETDHKTFELQTVKIMPGMDTENPSVVSEEPEDRNPDPGLRQADIPTVLSTRIQRRRSWTMGVVLVILGVAAGLGILALAKATRIEPLPADTNAEQPAAAATTAPSNVAPAEVVAESASSTAVDPPSPSPPAAASVQPPPAVRNDVPTVKPTSPSSTKPDAPASTKSTIPVPLGPPEF